MKSNLSLTVRSVHCQSWGCTPLSGVHSSSLVAWTNLGFMPGSSCGHLEWSKNMQRTWLHQLIMYDFKFMSLKIKTGPRHRAEGRYDKTLRPLHLFNGK